MANNESKRNSEDELTVPGDGQTVKVETKTEGSAQTNQADVDAQYDAQTQRMEASSVSGQAEDDERTRIVGGSRRRRRGQPKRLRTEARDAMDDPPAGWLVIVDGPGKGSVLTIGYGMNSIGRDEEERISIAFGDDQISRRAHAAVTYDSRGRKFYVQQGGGTNLVYLEDEVVLTPKELPEFSELYIGKTTLRFVALCGESFAWEESTQS